MRLVYSTLANDSLQEIVDFLNSKWTKKELSTMRKDIANFEKTLREGILKYPDFEGYPNTQFALIGKKQVKIIFRILDSGQVIIALFWHCKQNPQKLNDLLK